MYGQKEIYIEDVQLIVDYREEQEDATTGYAGDRTILHVWYGSHDLLKWMDNKTIITEINNRWIR